jgi:hypothetical protein
LEASRSVQGNVVGVSSSRRLYITGVLTQVNMSDPQSISDSRTYILYNDIFIYCQKIKPNNNSNKKNNKPESSVKLQYKGMISLKHADITPLSAKCIAKISEVKKSSAFGSFMRKSESQSSNVAANGSSLVYGFEIHINENAGDVMAVGVNFVPVPGNASSNGNKKVLIMRTQSEAEQNAWMALLRKTSRTMTLSKKTAPFYSKPPPPPQPVFH